jgi:AraC-like DNA-binding protein
LPDWHGEGYMTYSYRQLFVRIDTQISTTPRTTLDMLESELKIGRRTIERVVRNIEGSSFSGYRKARLIEKAIHFLIASSLSIKEIAAMLGYLSSASLSRFIRTETGMTPTEIRKDQSGGKSLIAGSHFGNN